MNPKLVLALHAVRSACLAGEKVYSVHDYVVQWRAQRGIQCQHRDAPHKKVFSPKAYAHNLAFRVKKLFGSSIKNVRISGVCTPCMSLSDLFAVRQLLEGIKQQRTRPGCPHGKKSTYYCRRCGGNGICEHARRRETCVHCDPAGYATKRIRHAIYMGIRKRHQQKDQRTLRYLGVHKFDEVIENLERKMDLYNSSNPTVRMTMYNTHIDHIKPVRQFTVESAATGHVDARMHHYTNLQPLLSKTTYTRATSGTRPVSRCGVSKSSRTPRSLKFSTLSKFDANPKKKRGKKRRVRHVSKKYQVFEGARHNSRPRHDLVHSRSHVTGSRERRLGRSWQKYFAESARCGGASSYKLVSKEFHARATRPFLICDGLYRLTRSIVPLGRCELVSF